MNWLGFGGWRVVVAGCVTAFGLPVLLYLLIVYVPWLNPTFVLVPVIAIPIAILARREARRERGPQTRPKDRYPT